MEFRTPVAIAPSTAKIRLSSGVLSAGSCFAEHIGERLVTYKVPTASNPFGTIFNPLSLFKLLWQGLRQQGPTPSAFLQSPDGLWKHYDFHSDFAFPSDVQLRKHLEDVLGKAGRFLKSANFLALTFGTAWVYERIDSGDLVANCHKMPAKLFRKRLLQVDEIVKAFEQLQAVLPAGLQVVLTVSPVRHLKDTLPLNSVSKSVLRLACHELETRFPNSVQYFPAYEIILDELRDYRFYASDMLHPSEVAVDYVWQQFVAAYGSDALQAFIPQWDQILQALKHRPLHPESPQYKRFLEDLQRKIIGFNGTIPIEHELKEVSARLKRLGQQV